MYLRKSGRGGFVLLRCWLNGPQLTDDEGDGDGDAVVDLDLLGVMYRSAEKHAMLELQQRDAEALEETAAFENSECAEATRLTCAVVKVIIMRGLGAVLRFSRYLLMEPLPRDIPYQRVFFLIQDDAAGTAQSGIVMRSFRISGRKSQPTW